MAKVKIIFLFIALTLTFSVEAQLVEIQGRVVASSDLGGIHIINKSSSRFTVTEDNGSFMIPAKLNDTIIASGIQYQPKEIIIDQIVLQTKAIEIILKDMVNELDEVIVGKVLTGNLLSDIENSDAKRDLNFYDVGIPGYTGRRKDQSERRLHEATTGGGIVPLNPLLNWISGRTKKLKDQIKREKSDKAMKSASERLSEVLFNIDDLEEIKRNEFFYFVADDPKFMVVNGTNNELQMLQFLTEKLQAFKIQSETD